MPVKTIAKRKMVVKHVRPKTSAVSDLDALKSIRGLWKRHKIDPVAYQRKIRAEADRKRGV